MKNGKFRLCGLFLLLTVLGICLASCYRENEWISKGPQVEFRVVDSVRFESGIEFVRIQGVNKQSFLGENAREDKLFLFNHDGEQVRVIDNKGEGPLEYREIVNFGLTPTDDILVCDGEKVLIFKHDSDEIISCPIDPNNLLAELNDRRLFANSDGRYFFSSTTREDPSTPSYFEHVHTFTTFSDGCNYNNIGRFPEESMFRKKVFIMGYDSRLAMNPGEDQLFQVFQWDPTLYILDVNTGQLNQSVPLQPERFGNIVHKKEDNLENLMYSLQKNSRFLDFVVGDEYIITYYMTGLRDEEITNSVVAYNNKIKELSTYLFSVYDRAGNKVGRDFENPNVDYLIGFDEAGRFLFQKIEEDESVMIYKADIVGLTDPITMNNNALTPTGEFQKKTKR